MTKLKRLIYHKNGLKNLETLNLFVLISLWQSLRVFFGVDLCDTGHHLLNQSNMITYKTIEGVGALTFLSDFIGGYWQSIFEKPLLLWVKLGGVLINAINAVLIYSILKNYFARKLAYYSVLASSIFIVSIAPYDLMINYYSFPSLIFNVTLFTLYSFISKEPPYELKHQGYFFLGFFSVILVFARFPLIVLLGSPLIICFWNYHKESEIKWKSFFVWFFGLLTCFLSIWFFMNILGFWQNYIESIFFTFSKSALHADNQETASLVKYILRGLKSLIIVIVSTTIFIVLAKILSNRKKVIQFIAVLVLFFIIIIIKTDGLLQAINRFREVIYVFSLCGATMMAFIERKKNEGFSLIMILSVIFALSMPLGSAWGLIPGVYGIWFCLPVTIMYLCNASKDTEYLNIKGMNSFVIQIIPVLVILSLFIVLVKSPRENWDMTKIIYPKQLAYNETFKNSQLRWIFATKEQVQDVDSLLLNLQKTVKPGDIALFYNHIGLFYWLTNTKSIFNAGVLYHSSEAMIENILVSALNKGAAPSCIVFNKGSESRQVQKEIMYLKNYFVNIKNYKMTFSNSSYEIYIRP